jgi:NAD+ kinase
MAREIKRVLVVASLEKRDAPAVLSEIQEYFAESDVELLSNCVGDDLEETRLTNTDLALSLGGDGTLLYCAKALAGYDIPVLGINLGNFGFITEVSRDEWRDTFELFIAGRLGVSHRLMVHVEVLRNGKPIERYRGLNDAVIGTKGIPRLIELRLLLSGSYVGRYRADGVIVATPTGSTAYSMGAGGPIVHPEMQAFILNPICPFTLSNRPLVVPAHEVIELEVEPVQRAEIMLTVDGMRPFQLQPGDKVRYTKSSKIFPLVKTDKRNFYEVLRAKLNWSGEPNA